MINWLPSDENAKKYMENNWREWPAGLTETEINLNISAALAPISIGFIALTAGGETT